MGSHGTSVSHRRHLVEPRSTQPWTPSLIRLAPDPKPSSPLRGKLRGTAAIRTTATVSVPPGRPIDPSIYRDPVPWIDSEQSDTMGSWFSSASPAPPPPGPTAQELLALRKLLMNSESPFPRSPRQQDHTDAVAMRDLANQALKHYNSTHPGVANFHCPCNLTTRELELKAACVGFRKDLWYHINFWARPRDSDAVEMCRFFTELRFEPSSDSLIIETCTVLEKPWCSFRSSCAFCPDESKILHPSGTKFKCGKQGHDNEFFRDRCGMDGRTKVFFSQSDMLRTPLMLGGRVPRYRLDYVEE